jgi:hypothetical protein
MAGRSAEAAVEVFCDESGSEGEKLIGGTTDVFAHGSVLVDVPAAEACIEEVRIGARSPATEVKASVVLRERNRRVLEWLLSPTGPLHGKAHVYLTEKTFQVVRKLVELLEPDTQGPSAAASEPSADMVAMDLYREAPHRFGAEPWLHLLASFNTLLRAKHRSEAWLAAEAFFGQLDVLRRSDGDSGAGLVMGRIADVRPLSDAALHDVLARLRGVAQLDPLIPAIGAAVTFWGAGGRPVAIVHDVQGALTAQRVAHLAQLWPRPADSNGNGSRPGWLAGIRFVDSQDDPRVQVADFLAGVARRIASEELNGRGDAELTALLRPYVDSRSIWGDESSWSRLAPGSHDDVGASGP